MPSNDPEYQKKYIRQHYQDNKDYYKQKARERKRNYVAKYNPILKRYKTMKGCIDCGYKDSPYALDFDHVKGVKTSNVSSMVGNQRPWKVIKAEVFAQVGFRGCLLCLCWFNVGGARLRVITQRNRQPKVSCILSYTFVKVPKAFRIFAVTVAKGLIFVAQHISSPVLSWNCSMFLICRSR